jgi:hypothetical protein
LHPIKLLNTENNAAKRGKIKKKYLKRVIWKLPSMLSHFLAKMQGTNVKKNMYLRQKNKNEWENKRYDFGLTYFFSLSLINLVKNGYFKISHSTALPTKTKVTT